MCARTPPFLFFLSVDRQVATNTSFEEVVSLMREAKNIIFVIGAGVSTSCGIPDFRSKDVGLYSVLKTRYPTLPAPEAMFDMKFFLYDPRPFFDFAKELFPGNFEPSPSHRFIKAFEEKGSLLRCYSQNIDTLESQAGIKKLVQCHGSFTLATCLICHTKVQGQSLKETIFAGVYLCTNTHATNLYLS
eukprot:m.43532 g.43532  ORF g.43532 m.43532 type:complete len:188 (+) comp10780_c0_seq4:376-939(+)